MAHTTEIIINGKPVRAQVGITIAAAILNAGVCEFRKSVSSEPRGPLCGMGICFECRATVNGVMHQRTCQRIIEAQMEISTDETR